VSQVLFGSDYPYYTIADNLATFDTLGFTPDQRRAIEYANAQRLMPRLRA
jgi:predicted TIM-barrel fold metal-dependent hydrolase